MKTCFVLMVLVCSFTVGAKTLSIKLVTSTGMSTLFTDSIQITMASDTTKLSINGSMSVPFDGTEITLDSGSTLVKNGIHVSAAKVISHEQPVDLMGRAVSMPKGLKIGHVYAFHNKIGVYQ